ncbi:MAG TPA: ATPase domain-containing protein [Candidatus Acidoferrales bacterium]|nr:ATPase domain-containing protein [Candidatus Acidoferrales bacterium]
MKEDHRQRAILHRLAGMRNSAGSPAAPIATGFAALDEVLGGGLPRGQMVEIFGPAGCGKTTLAIQFSARAQRGGLTAAWIDADHTFDAAWAARLGIDGGAMPLAQPDTAEQALETANTLAASAAVDLIVLDSAAALVPGLERSVGIGGAPGLHSRIMASGLRKLSRTLARSGTCMVFLNQMRNRLDPAGAGGETSAGGPPLKLYAVVRLMMVPSKARHITLRVLKNKVAARIAERQLGWRQGEGFVESP